jgi:hypothetical protein
MLGAMTRPLRDVVLQFLRDDGLEFDEAGPVLRLAYAGDNGRFVVFVRVDEQRQQLTCFAVCPLEAGARLPEVHELLQRINQQLAVVAFDVDPDTGVIRCRAGLDVEGDRLTPALVGNVVYACAAGLDEFLPAVTAVVVQQLDPRRALAALG